MATYKTEYEAWEAVWDILVGYGMPCYACGGRIGGLCVVISKMHSDKGISANLRDRMLRRINGKRELQMLYYTHHAKAAPRIPYVEKFMEECKR